MYNIIIPAGQLSDLWNLKKYAACGPIARQIREAIASYLQTKEKEFGCPPEDLAEARERHRKEQEEQDWRQELEGRIKDRNRELSKKIY